MAERENHLNNGRFFVDSSLDVVFAIDTTGSMEPYINEVKDNFLRIMEDVFQFSTGVRLPGNCCGRAGSGWGAGSLS